MAQSETAKRLAEVPLFADLTQRQVNRVAKVAHESGYQAGDVLMKERALGQKLILIVSGQASVTSDGRKIATVGPGDAVGEMSLIDSRPRSASVIADTALETIVIFRSDFRKVLEEMPAVWERLLVAQTARLRAADKALEARG